MTAMPRVAAASIAVIALFAGTRIASAQQEFPPPQGMGHVVLVSSGISGPEHYREVSADIAKALAMPHAMAGKIALVGFSAGGGELMYYATQWPDQVAVVAVWFPANSFIKDIPGFASRLSVPLLVFAGGKDHYRNECCAAAKDQTLADAAHGAGKTFELTVYPDADHDFSKGGSHYNPKDHADAFQKTADALMKYFPPN